MELISISDYAAQHNISYEAVRKQVVRYADELEGLTVRKGRQQFLTKEAVAFLDNKRQNNPVVLYESSKDEELEQLREQQKILLAKIAAQADELVECYKNAAADAKLLASAEQNRLALQAAQEDLERANQRAITAEALAQSEAQANAEAQQRAADAEAKAEEKSAEVVSERKRAEDILDKLNAAEGELEDLRSRPLSWRERLTGRRQ